MSKIVRKNQKIFGSSAGVDEISQFGSFAAASPAFSTDPDTIQALVEYLEGWVSAVELDNSPCMEDMNALCYLFARQLAYIFQSGIPEWNTDTTYYIGSFVSSGELIYQSITDSNTGNAVTDGNNWKLFIAGGASGLELLEQKDENEKFGLITDPLDNSVASGFGQPPSSYQFQGILLQAYTAGGTTLDLAWGPPAVLNPSDKNTTGTTNWSTDTNASTLTTSATRKVGATSVSFTKTNGGTSSRIVYDAGSAILSCLGFTELLFWVNLSSATGVSSVQVVIDINGTNTQTFTATTNSAGGALATGWNLIKIDLSTGGSAGGSGWTSSQLFRYFHVGIVTAASGTVPVVLINGIYFSAVSPKNFIPPGTELDIFDGTHVESAKIDSSNSLISGLSVALTAALSNNYSGGFANTSLYRSSLSIAGNSAIIGSTDPNSNSLAGAVTLAQTMRLSSVLRQALVSNTLSSSISVNTPQVYAATSVTGSTIVVEDPSNEIANLLTGDVVHVFRTVYDDGKAFFIYRGDMTLTGNATHSSTSTTLPGTPPASTAATDMIVKKNLSLAMISSVAIGANESFVNMTPVSSPDGILLYDNGLAIPYPGNVFGYWDLSGPNGGKNKLGIAPDLTTVGAVATNTTFFNGKFASSNFAAGRYYKILNGSCAPIDAPGTIAGSFWLFPDNTVSSFVVGKDSNSVGWAIGHDDVGNLYICIDGSTPTITGPMNVGAWNHIFFQSVAGATAGTKLYINGVLVGTSTSTISSSGVDLIFGSNVTASNFNPMGTGEALAQVLLWTGVTFNSSQISNIYNMGRAKILGFGPMLKYRFANSNMSGQKISIKGKLLTDTTAVLPSISQMGTIKTQ